jgi:hypothetical protein
MTIRTDIMDLTGAPRDLADLTGEETRALRVLAEAGMIAPLGAAGAPVGTPAGASVSAAGAPMGTPAGARVSAAGAADGAARARAGAGSGPDGARARSRAERAAEGSRKAASREVQGTLMAA